MSSRAFLAFAATLLLAACGAQHSVRHAGQPSPTTPSPGSGAAGTGEQAAPAPRLQALVTAETENRLLVVDLPSGRVAGQVALPPDPEDIAASSHGGVVITVSASAGKVTVLDRGTLRTIKSFDGFGNPHIAAIAPDGEYAYVTDDARGQVVVLGLSNDKLLARLSVGAGAHHLSFSPDERQVWVALGESASQIVILSTVVSAQPQPGSPVVDPGHPRVTGRFSPGFPVHDLSFTADGREVWITSASGPDVAVISARSRRLLFRVPVGPPPQHVVVAGRFAYLTSGYGGKIEKVDVTTGRVIARTGAPYGSFELAAGGGYVATSSLLRGTLAIYTPNLRLLRVVKLAPATREVAISRP